MLQRVYVDNFRCLVNFELGLAPCQLIVARNGCGKTSLWEVLAKLQDVVAVGTSVEDAFHDSSRTRWNTRREQRFELDARIEGGAYRYGLEVLHAQAGVRGQPRVTIRSEQLTVDGDLLYRRTAEGMVELYGDDKPATAPRAQIPFDERRSFLPSLQARPDSRRLRLFRDYVERMQLVTIMSPGIETESPTEDERLERDASNFGSWFRSRLMDKPGIMTPLEADLRGSIVGLEAIRFEKVGAAVRELVVDVKPDGGVPAASLGLGELSDGERALLVAYTLLHAGEPNSLLFLDEPDSYLAPIEIQPLLAKLRATVRDRDGQLLIASHHPETIDYLAAEKVVVLSRPGGGPVRVGGLDFDRESGRKASEWLVTGPTGT